MLLILPWIQSLHQTRGDSPYAIRTLMADTAAHAGRDPDRVSFVAALRIIRQSIAHAGDFSP